MKKFFDIPSIRRIKSTGSSFARLCTWLCDLDRSAPAPGLPKFPEVQDLIQFEDDLTRLVSFWAQDCEESQLEAGMAPTTVKVGTDPLGFDPEAWVLVNVEGGYGTRKFQIKSRTSNETITFRFDRFYDWTLTGIYQF